MTTPAAAGRDEPTGLVRPFAARVVRQDWAGRLATPMVDARGPGARRPPPRAPETAYEEAPAAFYVYRMGRDADRHVGVVADVRLDAFAARDVRGHEAVEADRVQTLVHYYAEHPERSEPVALLHDRADAVAGHVAAVCGTEPILHFEADDGLEHTLWRVDDAAATAAIATGLGTGIHYVADGHHRVAARMSAWDRAGRPSGAGVLCLLCPLDGLTLAAFHRRVRGPVDAEPLLAAAAVHFDVRRIGSVDEVVGTGLYVAGGWYDLTPTGPRPDGADGLDASLLHSRLLRPALGIGGPEHASVESYPAHVPLPTVVAACDDDGGALFVLAPPSPAELTRVADLGQVMPPKTTYFAPKPYAGIFLT